MFTAEILSRVQFAFNVGFHILWPSFNIGLALFLTIIEAMWLRTKNETYLSIYKFWVKIFALSFGMGVVTGIPMSFQFGTNWSMFSKFASPVIAPLMGIEIMTAFFLEATFLGVMLFGWQKVSPRMHFIATLLVCIGVHNSAIWILVVNSWMHTPAGFEVVNGNLNITNWIAAIFNPSFPYRLSHMLLASYTTAFVMINGISAYFLIKKRNQVFAKATLSVSLLCLLIVIPLQILVGDAHGLNTLKHQPAKVATMEGNWNTSKNVPSLLFAIPDPKTESNKFEVGIPNLTSIILTHSAEGEVVGLKDFAPENRPNIYIVFYCFRIMVALGMLILLVSIVCFTLHKMKKLENNKFLLYVMLLLSPMGFVAILAGWMVTEVGRQPWIVTGLMRISEGLSNVSPRMVASSLAIFVILYGILFVSYLYYLLKVIKNGPEDVSKEEVYGIQANKI